MEIKLFIDDIRDPLDNSWVIIRDPEIAINIISTTSIDVISLDHDLGEGKKTGYDIIKRIEEKCYKDNSFIPPKISIHSANPVGRANIEAALKSIEKNIDGRKTLNNKYKSCHDCGTKEGEIHDYCCDMERCPFCGGQLLICNCVYKKLNIDCSPGTDVYENGITEEQQEQWINILKEKGRIPYIIYPWVCARCGKVWPEEFYVSNEEWEKYIPIIRRDKILCLDCFNIIKNLIDNNGIKNV